MTYSHIEQEPKVRGGSTLPWHEPYVIDVIRLNDILDEAEKDFDNIYKEIEFNATEDTLFERMVLTRLKRFRTTWFGDKKNE